MAADTINRSFIFKVG